MSQLKLTILGMLLVAGFLLPTHADASKRIRHAKKAIAKLTGKKALTLRRDAALGRGLRAFPDGAPAALYHAYTKGPGGILRAEGSFLVRGSEGRFEATSLVMARPLDAGGRSVKGLVGTAKAHFSAPRDLEVSFRRLAKGGIGELAAAIRVPGKASLSGASGTRLLAQKHNADGTTTGIFVPYSEATSRKTPLFKVQADVVTRQGADAPVVDRLFAQFH